MRNGRPGKSRELRKVGDHRQSRWLAEAFEWLKAIFSQGGTDTKEVGTLDYLLETEGPWLDI